MKHNNDLPDNYTHWVSFGMTEAGAIVTSINMLPDEPEQAGIMVGTLIEHMRECYKDHTGKDISQQLWTGIISTLNDLAENKHVYMPVQGDES